jgi:uncharacterized protein YukE
MIAKTKEMIQIAKDIDALALEYKTLISEMYTKISDMPSFAWSGTRAREYIGYVMSDKEHLLSVADKIKSVSNTIINDANLVEQGVSRIWKEGSNG